MRAIQLTAFGNPIDQLREVALPEPPPPGADQVLIGVEYAPVNRSDLSVARGIFPVRPALPGVIGNEGVGRVLAVGAGVRNVVVGDRVLAPLYGWTWAERVIAPAAGLVALPADADPQQLAMLGINPPTAALMLSDYVTLSPGDWVVQNAGNSGVGRSVIAFAKARGLRTINLVRRTELIDELAAAGGDINVLDDPGAPAQVKQALGPAAPRLALDGVGGASTANLAAILGTGGTLVTYSAMSRSAMSISGLDVVFKQLTVRGFLLGPKVDRSKIAAAIAEGAQLIQRGQLYTPVAATYALSQITAAIEHAERGGKILLDVVRTS